MAEKGPKSANKAVGADLQDPALVHIRELDQVLRQEKNRKDQQNIR